MTLNRRRFIQRLGRAGMGLTAASSIANASRFAFAAATEEPLRLCLLSGSEEYKSNESLTAFQELLEKKYPIRCARAFWTSKTNLPGLEALDSCDVMLLFTERLELPPEQLDRIKKYCLAGRPIVGVRTASHAFQNWLELDRDILGGNYKGHYGSGLTTKVTVAANASDHPILNGFKPFETSTKLYKNPRIAEDTQLLLSGAIPKHTEPVAWTREYGGGRIFYTSLGGPPDFENEVFRNLLINGIYWTAKRTPVS
jgi:type 1 glutamine amidotransferase